MMATTVANHQVAVSPHRKLNRGRLIGLAAMAAVGLCLIVVSVAVGSHTLSLTRAWEVLWNPDHSFDSAVVWGQRMPRTAIAAVVGAALGLAGALIQGLTRNPLADPGLLGLSNGAALAMVVVITVFGWTAPMAYIWSGLAAAAVTGTAVYLLGSAGRSNASPVRLILAGTAVNAVLASIISAMSLLDSSAFERLRFWQTGSIAGRDLSILTTLGPIMVAGGVLALGLAGSLNAMALGDEAGRSLGVKVGRTRILCVLAVTILTATAVAIAGPIVFIGLLVPHMVRLFTGPDHRWLLPAAAIAGACLLLAADSLGRIVLARDELEVGLVTAIIGAPLFIVILRRRKLVGS